MLAVSTASEPELEKNACDKPGGAMATNAAANLKALECDMRNDEAKSRIAAACWIAETMGVRACPALTHHKPAMPYGLLRFM